MDGQTKNQRQLGIIVLALILEAIGLVIGGASLSAWLWWAGVSAVGAICSFGNRNAQGLAVLLMMAGLFISVSQGG